MLIRRNVSRFRIGSPDNNICWNRSVTEDSFISPIDGHNHFRYIQSSICLLLDLGCSQGGIRQKIIGNASTKFNWLIFLKCYENTQRYLAFCRPFGGPAVPRQTYLDWMFEHGILFTTMFGIGQQMIHDPDKPMCCYYFHCPSLDYIVTPGLIPLNSVEFIPSRLIVKSMLLLSVKHTIKVCFSCFHGIQWPACLAHTRHDGVLVLQKQRMLSGCGPLKGAVSQSEEGLKQRHESC